MYKSSQACKHQGSLQQTTVQSANSGVQLQHPLNGTSRTALCHPGELQAAHGLSELLTCH